MCIRDRGGAFVGYQSQTVADAENVGIYRHGGFVEDDRLEDVYKRQGLECVSVIFAQSVPSAEPDEAFLVLKHSHYSSLGETVIDRKVLDLTNRLGNDEYGY